jgi:phospholipid/cholesterol/gamma-HCH transport system permease protein
MIKFAGHCILNLFKSFKYILSGKVSIKEIIKQGSYIGFDSLWISMTIVFVAGAVISLQLAQQFILSGTEGYIGAVVSFTLIRELAPGFAAFAISARSGTAMAAEIANMKITEQVDAMKTLGVDPIKYLIAPRVLASMIVVPLVVMICEVVGLYGGLIVSQATINLHPNRFLDSVWTQTKTYDVGVSLVKASIFGVIITVVCCTMGYITKGGAKDVGDATIKAAMYTTIVLLLADFLLSWIFFV